MNKPMRKQNDRLKNEAVVFRALRKGWIHKDTKKVQAVAFLRRPGDDDDGISVSQSAENVVKLLRKVDKAAKLKVLEIRSAKRIDGTSFNFDVIHQSIEEDRLHALITEVPYYYDSDPKAGMEAADAILGCPSLSIISVTISSVPAS